MDFTVSLSAPNTRPAPVQRRIAPPDRPRICACPSDPLRILKANTRRHRSLLHISAKYTALRLSSAPKLPSRHAVPATRA
jgi:hypothetical protein